MGAWNTRSCFTPLHSKFEFVICGMECMITFRQITVTFVTDIFELVKMVCKLKEWPAFANYLEEFLWNKDKYDAFVMTHVLWTQNTWVDSFGARSQPFYVVRINTSSHFGLHILQKVYFNQWIWKFVYFKRNFFIVIYTNNQHNIQI